MTDYEKGIVLWHTTMSLDGFIAGPKDDMDWIFNYEYSDPFITNIIESIGALLVGSNTYNVGQKAREGPISEAYGGAWSGPEFILTHKPPKHISNKNKTFINENIATAIDIALKAAHGKNINVLGANIATQCIENKLIDEIIIQLVPVLLGNGVHLFNHTGLNYTKLEPIEISRDGDIVNLHYKVIYE